MPDDPFHKWWPCLKKHYKRTKFWLPEVKQLHEGLNGRDFRYFTLCARPMIDVYMLVKEKILPYDEEHRRINGVIFCECVEAVIGEMRELVGVEESGFCGFLEDLVLFKDGDVTAGLADLKAISEYIETEGESISDELQKELLLKRAHLGFRSQFPFDFINLDYCDRYYGSPPNVLRVHEAVEQILRWQTQLGHLQDGSEFELDRFVLAITCRTDEMLDNEAKARLEQIVVSNCESHPEYLDAMKARALHDVSGWHAENHLDFFMASWPKEIARLANALGWDIEVKSHSFYDREDSEKNSYNMVCLVAEFSRATSCSTYLPAAIHCLNPATRSQIPEFDAKKAEGAKLVADLQSIVQLRNEQAARHGVPLLPDPLQALTAAAK